MEPEIALVEEAPHNEPEQAFSALGSRPNPDNAEGQPIHEEIVLRWNGYLQKGLTKDQRVELMDRYKLPSNCKTLIPPQLNNEIQPCLPKSATEHDKFMVALQQQLAHGLSAVGAVLDRLLPIQGESENLKTLAEACQLFTNVHYAISAHRKFRVSPHLTPDCRKVAKTLEMDEFLFGKAFAEAVKNEQAIKKASTEFKKKTWQPSTLPGPSRTQPQQHLNYQRIQYKGRMKEQRREERPPQGRYRMKPTTQTKPTYHRK